MRLNPALQMACLQDIRESLGWEFSCSLNLGVAIFPPDIYFTKEMFPTSQALCEENALRHGSNVC